jgi:hypothetical protein
MRKKIIQQTGETLAIDPDTGEVLDANPDAMDRPIPPPLRILCDLYYQTQRDRIALGNQISAIERGADDGAVPPALVKHFTRLQEMEDVLADEMGAMCAAHVAMPWIGNVVGLGPRLTGKVLALIGDIGKFDTISKLWRFAGYAVINGARERPVKGERLHYNIRLKTTCYLIVDQFVKNRKSPYRAIYDSTKEFYTVHRPAWTKGHVELATRRKVAKLFLSHLWLAWREIEGLPLRDPFVQSQLGHTSVPSPWSFATRQQRDAA